MAVEPAPADTPPPAPLLAPLHWRAIGPYRGGRVLTVSGVPGQPHHFYFGAVNGGVWETQDAGRTWKPVFDAAPVGSIGALAVAPSDPRVIYVGTGEADMRSDIAQGVGMYRSGDGGASWQPIGLEDSQQIGRILVDPANPNTLLVAALGHPYGPNETRGVFRSSDGGKSWQRTLYRDENTGAIDLSFEPGNAQVVYASLWQTRRPPWNVYPPSSGPGSGLYKSTDGGLSWRQLTTGLPAQPGRIGIAVAPSAPRRVYALIDATDGGLYVSGDAGASFTRLNPDRRIWGRGWYFGGITVNPRNPDDIYIANTALYRSQDGGRHFVPFKGAPGGDDYHTLWIDPAEPQRQILGVDQGAVVTLNGGATWSSWFNQGTAQLYHVITDNRFPYWVYGAQQDSGAAGVPSRTDNVDGINLRQFTELAPGGESDNIAPDPDNPQVIYGGRVQRLDLGTQQTQSIPPTLAYPGLYRETWTLPLVFGPGHTLYFGNQRIYATTDGGKHWQPLSPDLSRPAPGVPANLDPPTVEDNLHAGPRRGVVYSIGPSPRDSKLLWAGTDDGLIWRTRDGGAHWQDVTPKELTAWSKVGAVEPSHFDANSAYAAIDRHRLDDPQPYIYRTHDGGASWKLIVTGIADQSFLNTVNVVREDPQRQGLLFAGTERGVYVSFDDGARWVALQLDLPRTSVRDIQVHGDDLVIATHGRGFYIMDDIALLRALAGDAGPATRLLPPATAYRVRPTGFTGSPMPKDEARGENPPLGALIDYVLDGAAAGPVQIIVRNSEGAVVRTYRSDDKHASPDLTTLQIAPDWVPPGPVLGTRPGAHRFVWDLHYATAAPALPAGEDEDEAPGIWAPPGRYQLELSAGGHTYTQPLTVLPDPRVKLPQTAYEQELQLARQIERARLELQAAREEAGKIHTQLTQLVRQEGPAAQAAADADQRLLALTGIGGAERRGSAAQATSELPYLASAFTGLARAVDGADAAPSADAQTGYTRHRELLTRTLAAWSSFKSQTLADLNNQLKAAGAAPINP